MCISKKPWHRIKQRSLTCFVALQTKVDGLLSLTMHGGGKKVEEKQSNEMNIHCGSYKWWVECLTHFKIRINKRD